MSGFSAIMAGPPAAEISSDLAVAPEQYGARGDGVTDDAAAINSAIQAAYSSGKHVLLGDKTYYCGSRILLNAPIHFLGQERQDGTVLKFRNGIDGIYVASQGGPAAGGGSRAVIKDLRIITTGSVAAWSSAQSCVANVTCFKPVAGYSGFIYECTTTGTSGTIEPVWPTTDGATIAANGGTAVFTARYVCGIKILANSVSVERVTISTWPGDGLGIPADSGAGDNGNTCYIGDSRFDSCLGYGAHPNGPDANWCVFEKCDFTSNVRGGAFDRSALGCVWNGCHFDSNSNYAFDMYDAVETLSSCAHIEGAYLEGGQTARIAASAMWVGGLNSQNVDTTNGGILDAAGPGRNTMYMSQTVSAVSRYLRLMRQATQILQEFGTGDDSSRAFQFIYKTVNLAAVTGWWGWLYNNATTPWAVSNSLAAEGGGQMWMPNGFYAGDTDYKVKYSWGDAAPTTGAHIAGEVVFDRATLENVWCWVCTTAGTPGTWTTIYLPTIYGTTLTTAGTTITVNWTNAQTQVIDLQGASGNVTLTLSNPQAGQRYKLKVIQSSTARNLIWPAAVKWPGGTAPTISVANDAIDVIDLFYDGTNYLSTFSQAFA